MALTDKLTAIGNAIREKTGGTDLLTLDQMPTEISNIQGGGTVEELTITSNGTYNPPTGIDGYAPVVVNVPQDGGPPAKAFNITGAINKMFYNGKWDWFIETYGNQITMNDITTASGCFDGCRLTSIPISSINFNYYGPRFDSIFSNCDFLEEPPKITFKNAQYAPMMQNMFQDCHRLRELPNDYFTSMSDDWDALNSSDSNGDKMAMFQSCFSLRKLPDITCLEQYGQPNIYYYVFNGCFSLDEIINYPVMSGTLTWNAFDGFVDSCSRLKNLTFKTNEGTPIVAQFKNTTIDLTRYIGYVFSGSTDYITDYNSGITKDKQVKDDATYQALKDDPDYWTDNINYSRYNHDSAVRTINSLPDTSAYLTANGGTNTIKFKGQSGASTDGGAINTLTEEEIAVATAKGWTVSLV